MLSLTPPLHSLMANTAVPQLKDVLLASATLVGLADQPRKLTSAKDSLAAVLARRLAATSDQLHLVHLPESPTEFTLKLATAQAALTALQLIATSVTSPATPTASTSSTLNAPPPPTFGVKDAKIIGMLAGIVARWGISLQLAEGVLPRALVDKQVSKGKITELIEDEKGGSYEGLVEAVQGLLGITRVGKEAREGSRQLAQVVAPQVLLPLLGGLLQLGHQPEHAETGEWARSALHRLCMSSARFPSLVFLASAMLTELGFRFYRTSPTIVISNLLALLSSAPNAPATGAWLRPAVSSLLSSQLLRAGGVRSLLLVVVGAGAAAGGEDEVGVAKLDMLSRLLSARANGTSEQVSVDPRDYSLHPLTPPTQTRRTTATSPLSFSPSSKPPQPLHSPPHPRQPSPLPPCPSFAPQLSCSPTCSSIHPLRLRSLVFSSPHCTPRSSLRFTRLHRRQRRRTTRRFPLPSWGLLPSFTP